MNAYSKLYLEDAMRTLGEAFDYAYFGWKMPLGEFASLFASSSLGERFGKGDPSLISGLSGAELSMKVLKEAGLEKEGFPDYQPPYEQGCEYWCGHILAYYQWARAISFKEILDKLPLDEIASLYPALHEASEERFLEAADSIIESRRGNKLKERRKLMGYTQKELSGISGVSLRAIQQYEIGAKDLNKASALTVYCLARALLCQAEDLLSVPLKDSH